MDTGLNSDCKCVTKDGFVLQRAFGCRLAHNGEAVPARVAAVPRAIEELRKALAEWDDKQSTKLAIVREDAVWDAARKVAAAPPGIRSLAPPDFTAMRKAAAEWWEALDDDTISGADSAQAAFVAGATWFAGEASPSLPSPAWQPIETAPKDARMILVAARTTRDEPLSTMFAYWSHRLEWWFRLYAHEPTRIYPTHWLPLPAAPSLAPRRQCLNPDYCGTGDAETVCDSCRGAI